MEMYSARNLGQKCGLTAEEMNVLLKEEGYLEGEPGNYSPTEKGQEYSEERGDGNEYGGKCAVGWHWFVWALQILDEIDLSDERITDIREKTANERHKRKVRKQVKSDDFYSQTVNGVESDENINNTTGLSWLLPIIGAGIIGFFAGKIKK